MKAKIKSVTLPAGKYWVGDPCYAIADDDQELWMAFLENSNYFDDSIVATVGDKSIVGITTAFGDGTYLDQYGNEYGVDAGLIGVAPDEEWVDSPCLGMRLVEFDGEFTVTSEDAVIVIGHIRINTDPPDEDDYYYEDEQEDDEDD